MKADYQNKKDDFISQAFINVFTSLSQDYVGDIFDVYLSVPIYLNPDNRDLDRFNILWQHCPSIGGSMDEDLYGIAWVKDETEIEIKEFPENTSWLEYIGNNKNVKHEVL